MGSQWGRHVWGKGVLGILLKKRIKFLTYGRNGVATYGEKGVLGILPPESLLEFESRPESLPLAGVVSPPGVASAAADGAIERGGGVSAAAGVPPLLRRPLLPRFSAAAAAASAASALACSAASHAASFSDATSSASCILASCVFASCNASSLADSATLAAVRSASTSASTDSTGESSARAGSSP